MPRHLRQGGLVRRSVTYERHTVERQGEGQRAADAHRELPSEARGSIIKHMKSRSRRAVIVLVWRDGAS